MSSSVLNMNVWESTRKLLVPADIRFVVSFPRYGRLKLESVLEQQGAKQHCPEVSVDGGVGGKGSYGKCP